MIAFTSSHSVEAYRVYTITKLRKTCDSCPAQWEGETSDGQQVYIRYRWGYLSVKVDPDYAVGYRAEEVVSERLGDNLDGSLSFAQLKKACKGKIQFAKGICE